ncbi:hypothetical protein G7Y89_g13527 [Cudoniella acicularis]|uniref:Apple domain-containing protein n=1 Tax=Cudoniella acicularis TaxID=354080 RepID=A0A8H4VVZ5_9HELO|nr:hypothetical protein G7Y89_g13527 [Cudoniella acicularis]
MLRKPENQVLVVHVPPPEKKSSPYPEHHLTIRHTFYTDHRICFLEPAGFRISPSIADPSTNATMHHTGRLRRVHEARDYLDHASEEGMALSVLSIVLGCVAMLVASVEAARPAPLVSTTTTNLPATTSLTRPPIATVTSSVCHVEGRLNSSLPLFWTMQRTNYPALDVVDCQMRCDNGDCHFFSMNPKTLDCITWQNVKVQSNFPDINTAMPIEPAKTGVFFYSRRAHCVNYVDLNITSTKEFTAGGENVWINNQLDDCGFEGKRVTNGGLVRSWALDNIIDCQDDCSNSPECRSYSFNSTAAAAGIDDSCFEYVSYLGNTVVAEAGTGVYFSDSSAKINNICFRNSSSTSIPSKVRRQEPTSTIAGIPAITSTLNSECNIQGHLPETTGSVVPYHSTQSFVTSIECMYACLSTTFCQAYSWNITSTSFNNKNCVLYGTSISELAVVASNTDLFFSSKQGSCFGVAPIQTLSTEPFAGEAGIYVNTAVNDCGVEGSSSTIPLPGQGGVSSYRYNSVMDCQALCNSENGCISYAWVTNTTGNNCAYSYTWLAGNIVEGKTGVYWSEGKQKTGPIGNSFLYLTNLFVDSYSSRCAILTNHNIVVRTTDSGRPQSPPHKNPASGYTRSTLRFLTQNAILVIAHDQSNPIK